jgi:riboflavin kinase, archaea type
MVETFKVLLLIKLAKRGALQSEIRISTAEIASELNISQQTASRWLSILQSEGFTERRFSHLFLTAKAKEELENFRKELDSVFEINKKKLRLVGKVVSGMREGRFYLSIKEYKKQIKSVLDYEVFPGTLNLRLEGHSAGGKRTLMNSSGIEITGFKKNGRTLGGAKLFKCKIFCRKKIATGAAIIPYKSHYGIEILELVSGDNLRKTMNLKNDDEVEVLLDI